MRTKQATGARRTGGRASLAGTAAAALAVVAATGAGVANAAVSVPARPSFDYIGDFHQFDDAPKGTGPIGGLAAMVVTRHGTTTSISVTGLDPKAVYIANVHATSCFINKGSGPFLYDPEKPPVPPNAIWLWPITIDKKGTGTASTTSAAPAGPRAKSVVLFLKKAAGALVDAPTPVRLACADLPRITS
jgi:hypothetical protein